MPSETATQLTAFLRQRAEEHLRGVAFYDPEGYDLLYVRDDIKGYRLKSEVDAMITRLQQESSTTEEAAFPFGDLDATVRCFEEAIVMHLPQSEENGILVTMEPEAADQLNTFIGECLARVS